MRGFTEVTTQAELDAFEDVVDGFIDAVVKEARLLSRGNMFDVQLLVQSANLDQDVEIVLHRVESYVLCAGVLDDGLPCTIRETGTWPPREVTVGDLTAAEFFYRKRPKSGPGAVLEGEMPSPVAVPASDLGKGWRQCSECSDAWEESPARIFSRCPSCGALTELIAE